MRGFCIMIVMLMLTYIESKDRFISSQLNYVELSTGFTEKKIVSFIGGPMFCLKHQQILKGQVGDTKDVLLISAAQNEWSSKIFTQTIIEYF